MVAIRGGEDDGNTNPGLRNLPNQAFSPAWSIAAHTTASTTEGREMSLRS
jgi:hypothetical protein